MKRYDDPVNPWRREFRKDVNRVILAWCSFKRWMRGGK